MTTRRILQKISAIILAIFPAIAAAQTTTEIQATIQITNNPANGATLTVNGSTRTWTNNATASPATQIQTTNSINNATTNLFQNVSIYPFDGTLTERVTNDTIRIIGARGAALTASSAGTWATITLVTNTYTNQYPVNVPIAVEPSLTARTNIASLLVAGIQTYSTQAWTEATAALSNHVNRGATQTLGNKTITNSTINQTLITNAILYASNSILTGGRWTNANIVAGTNTGSAFVSYNIGGLSSLQLGFNARADSDSTIAIGNGSQATNLSAIAIGKDSFSDDIDSMAIGTEANAGENAAVAIGNFAFADATNAIALGVLATAQYPDSIAIGTSVTAGAPWQIAIGGASHTNIMSGVLHIGTGLRGTIQTITNGTAYGITTTNALLSGRVATLTNGYWTNAIIDVPYLTNSTLEAKVTARSIAYPPKNYTGLANGNNAAVPLYTNSVLIIGVGPTAAFSIAGIVGSASSGGADGQRAVIINKTTQNMTILNDSGVDPTAANRIYTYTGADITTTGQGSVTLTYDATQQRWIVTASSL